MPIRVVTSRSVSEVIRRLNFSCIVLLFLQLDQGFVHLQNMPLTTITSIPDDAEVWLHEESNFKTGIEIDKLRYVGSLRVNVSYKEMDIEARLILTREAIARVCDEAGLYFGPAKQVRDTVYSRNPDIFQLLGTKPNLDHSGEEVSLTVTMKNVVMVSTMSGARLARHPIYRVTFVTSHGGYLRREESNYAAYIVHDTQIGRVCMVFDCGERTTEFSLTLAQACKVRRQLKDQEPEVSQLTAITPIQNALPERHKHGKLGVVKEIKRFYYNHIVRQPVP